MTIGRDAGHWLRIARDLPAVMAAAAMACVVEVGLRTATLPHLAHFLGIAFPASGPVRGSATDLMSGPPVIALPDQAKRQIRATRRVMRHWPFGDTCLRQALVAGQRLRRLRPILHVGVARVDSEIRAHAWLVIGGGVLDPLAAAASYHDLSTPGERPSA